MSTFRSRPFEVDAEQFRLGVVKPLPFCTEGACCLGPNGWYVVTMTGQEVSIQDGDWIIREPGGRGFYPCADEVFTSKYEKVE